MPATALVIATRAARRGPHRARHARRHQTKCCPASCPAVDITNERIYRATPGTASPSRYAAAVAILNGGTSGMRGNIALLLPNRESCSRFEPRLSIILIWTLVFFFSFFTHPSRNVTLFAFFVVPHIAFLNYVDKDGGKENGISRLETR